MATMSSRENPSLAEELRVAVTTASLGENGATRRIMLVDSNLPSLIPSQSLLKVRSVKLSELKMGDVICVRVGSSFLVRRFIKVKMTKNNTILLTAQEGYNQKEPIPMSGFLGKVDEVEHAGRSYNPLSKQNFFQSFMGKLTEYGTHKPFGIG